MLEQRSFQFPSRAVAVILAGGRGNRLYELTERRANAALYFGGVLEHPGVIKDIQRVKDSWNAAYQGSGNAHRIEQHE